MRALGWAAVWLVAAALFIGVALHPPNNLDVDWYLVATRTLAAEGGELYERVRDPNPPAVWQLFIANDALARWADLPAHRVYYALTALFSLAMLLWSALLLPAGQRPALLLGGAFLLGFAAVEEAGQRDLLAAAAFLPYLAWIQRLSHGQPGHRAAGGAATLLAGLALLLKPYFLLYFIVLEALLARRRGSWRTWLRADLLWPAGAVLLLGTAQLLAHPAYLDYLGDYGAFYASWPAAKLPARGLYALLALLAALVWLSMRRGWADWSATLAVAGCAAVLTAAAQNKWWDYHIYPITLFAGLAWVSLIARERLLRTAWRIPWALLSLIVAAWFGALALRGIELHARYKAWDPVLYPAGLLAREIDLLAPGARLGILGGYDGTIAAYLSCSAWALSDPPFWMVQQVAERRLQGEALRPIESAAEARHLAELAARLERAPPEILAFHRGEAERDIPDALAYYRLDPQLAAILDRRYRSLGSPDTEPYHLFQLIEAQAGTSGRRSSTVTCFGPSMR